MKIHASYFILWALGYIYTSAEGITTAHVDSWNTNSSCPQNCLAFWLVFLLLPCCCTLREHFYMKLTISILPSSHLAPWVLSPVVADLWDVLAKLRNSNILWYNYLSQACYWCLWFVITGFVPPCSEFFQENHAILSREDEHTFTVVLLCSSTSTIWSLQSNCVLGYRLLF